MTLTKRLRTVINASIILPLHVLHADMPTLIFLGSCKPSMGRIVVAPWRKSDGFLVKFEEGIVELQNVAGLCISNTQATELEKSHCQCINPFPPWYSPGIKGATVLPVIILCALLWL